MKRLTLTLTLLFASASLYALDLHKETVKKRTIGEEIVELQIVGGTEYHYLDGCDEQGFHLAVEEKAKDIYTFTTYCGAIPEGITKYQVIRDTGI